MGYGTIVTRYVARRGIAQMCLLETSVPVLGSPKPLHLKPGQLNMEFFRAQCRLGGAFPV